eukprot:gene2936-4003_t
MGGVITIDDVVDVIEEEADEDLKALGGVTSDEELSDSFWTIAKGRFSWLIVNLATAFLASSVLGLFEGQLEQMVALAVLAPIVASQGGNAATQTMTVAVRALATRCAASAWLFPASGRARPTVADQLVIGTVRPAEHIAEHLILGAWMTDADTQAQVFLAQMLMHAAQTVMTAVTAGALEFHRADRQIEFIVGDQDVARRDLVERRQRLDGLAALVHEGHRLEQQHLIVADADARHFALERRRTAADFAATRSSRAAWRAAASATMRCCCS